MTPASEFQCGTQESESEPGPESPQARWQAQALSLPPSGHGVTLKVTKDCFYYYYDTADPQEVLSFVGAAQAPSGYKILESCPSLETDENMQNLIGTQILACLGRQGQAGMVRGKGAWAQPQRA